jgi:hypothetical protein
MAFEVEDGSGIVGAVSYASVACYRSFCDERGIDLTGVSDTTIQKHLVSGTALVDTVRWNGRPRFLDNLRRRGLPRLDLKVGPGNAHYAEGYIVPPDEIPWVVPEAVCILAEFERSTGEGLMVPRDPAKVVVEKEVGPIKKKFAGSVAKGVAEAVGQRRYPEAEALLRGLHGSQAGCGGGGTVIVV